MKNAIRMSTLLIALTASIAVHAADTKWANGMLTDASGFTLYSFDKDGKDKSNCNAGCAAAWPPAAAAAGDKASGEFAIISRDDGSKQWAYKGMPLYRYAADQKAGDVTGDNSGKVWHIVRTGGKTSSAPADTGSASGGYKY